MDRARSTLRYRPRRRADEPALSREIKRLARRHPRYGYRRVHALLVRRGWPANLKRVRRLWNELGLRRPLRLRKPRKLGPKRGASANSSVQQPAEFKNEVWTCDFIHDRTTSGRSLKWLTLVDEDTRECLVLHAAQSITGADVRRIFARVIGRRGAPTRIRSDNGSEFVCEALVGWLPGTGADPSRWIPRPRGRAPQRRRRQRTRKPSPFNRDRWSSRRMRRRFWFDQIQNSLPAGGPSRSRCVR
jgi:hypothetical protein